MMKPAVPNEECIARGTKLLCQIARGADGRNGAILDERGNIRWQYGIRKHPPGHALRNPFNKPDFIVAQPDAKGELVIRSASLIPPIFNIIEGGHVIGNIAMRSLFRNKYFISLHGAHSWLFRMPLFTVRFYGESNESIDVWVSVGPSKMEWNVLIKPGVAEWPLAAALAFIHNEWWNYG